MNRTVYIDTREGELNTYVFDSRKGKYNIKENRKFPVSDRSEFALDIKGQDKENVFLSLPLEKLNFRVLDLPFSDKDKIREILPIELDGMILGGSEKVVFDDIVIGTTNDRYQVLAVFIEKTFIREILAKLEPFNIDPVCITSLELRKILKEFTLEKLVSPPVLDDEERIALAAEDLKAPIVNLRKGEFIYARDVEKTRKSLKVTAVLALLLAVVISSDLLLKIISTRKEIASIRNEMRKIYQEIFPGEKNIVNELYQLKSHMKELKSKEDFFIGTDLLARLNILSRIDRQGVVFNEITVDRKNLTLKGEAMSLSNIQQLKGRLESLFNEVNIADSKASSQGNMLFTITAISEEI